MADCRNANVNETCSGREYPGTDFREAVCIHTDKIYDSCRDKDCLEDLRVYLTRCGQEAVDSAISVKGTKAEVIWVFTDVEPVPFNNGFYSVDLQYYFKITFQVYTGLSRPTEVEGLATFSKKVILFGSEGNAKIFESKFKAEAFDRQLWKKTNLPHAIVEVVNPIVLGARVLDARDKNTCCCDDILDIASVPDSICGVFEDSLVSDRGQNNLYVSLGVFSIIKLERHVQLLIPSYDFCIPTKECVSATDDNPCDLFDRIDFPVDEFFPPERCEFLEDGENDPSVEAESDRNCGCDNNGRGGRR